MYEKAYPLIQKAIELSPKKQSFLSMKVILEMQTKRNAEAFATAKASYDIEPRNEEAKRLYVASLVLVNRAAEAEAFATTTADRIAYLQDSAVLNAYLETKQSARAIALIPQGDPPAILRA